MYEAQCVDGPMDGQDGHSRFPEGFLLIKPDFDGLGGTVWIYDYDEKAERFVLRPGSPWEVDDEKAYRTANEARFDVRAFDEETMEV